ncbi:MAG: TolC family protein [Phycisphaeraceae bacterium]|nr:TolC family protein [Phycisphaeraceae bacterium]
MTHRPLLFIFAAALHGSALIGCSANRHLERANRDAYRVIEQAQLAATGRTEPFAIEPPSAAFRRQLLEGQDLAVVGRSSFGSALLDPPAHWPADLDLPQRVPVHGVDALDQQALDESLVVLNLIEALSIAAGNSREYQNRKEDVFRTALDLDLARQEFRTTFRGVLDGTISADPSASGTTWGVVGGGRGTLSQRLESGVSMTTRLGLDLAQLLGPSRATSLGLFADGSVEIPLLRGAGRHIVREGLTQAERETIYAIWEFERFKSVFAVRVAAAYLGVLQQRDQVRNAEENYRRLVFAASRARRLAEGGRIPEIQVDQATQDELRARNRWISAREGYQRRLDDFKILLGLPTDARIELDAEELERMSARLIERLPGVTRGFGPRNADAPDAPAPPSPPEAPESPESPAPIEGPQPPETSEPAQPLEARPDQGAPTDAVNVPAPRRAILPDEIELELPDDRDRGPLELDLGLAIDIAFGQRTDLKAQEARIEDRQRRVVVAADALGAELTLLGRANLGQRRSLSSATQPDSLDLRPDRGFYEAILTLDLPIERTRERIALRNSVIDLERAVRSFEALEDQVKLEIRDALRRLLEFRETVRIQKLAVQVATRRVESTNLFLQAGRAEIRDVLEAQESLLSAQNALTSALISYRTAELELQRDLGVLRIDHRGLWTEYDPEEGLRDPDAQDQEEPQP